MYSTWTAYIVDANLRYLFLILFYFSITHPLNSTNLVFFIILERVGGRTKSTHRFHYFSRFLFLKSQILG